MKLLTFSLLCLLTSCGTTIPLSTGKFKTYADADSLAVSDGTVSVTMVNVNHSRTNEVWAGAVKTLGSDTLRTVRHYLTMAAFAHGLWQEQARLRRNGEAGGDQRRHAQGGTRCRQRSPAHQGRTGCRGTVTRFDTGIRHHAHAADLSIPPS